LGLVRSITFTMARMSLTSSEPVWPITEQALPMVAADAPSAARSVR
jgi:hypothetical protein